MSNQNQTNNSLSKKPGEKPLQSPPETKETQTPQIDTSIDKRNVKSGSFLERKELSKESTTSVQVQDNEAIQLLNSISENLDTETKKKIIQTLEITALTGLFTKLYENSTNKETFLKQFSNFENFKNINVSTENLTKLQKKAYEIFQNISNTPNSEFFQIISQRWNILTEQIQTLSAATQTALNLDLTNSAANDDKEKSDILSSITNFVKEHPYLTALTVVGGGLMIKHFFFNSKENSKNSFLNTIWDSLKSMVGWPGALILLALASAGTYINRQEIFNWFYKNLPSLNLEKLINFWKHFQEEEYTKAFLSLWSGEKNKPNENKESNSNPHITKFINRVKSEQNQTIQEEVLKSIYDLKLTDFLNTNDLSKLSQTTLQKFKDFITSFSKNLEGFGEIGKKAHSIISNLLKANSSPEIINQLQAIQNCLNQHRSEINSELKPSTTVLEAITLLEQKSQSPSSTLPNSPTPTPSSTPESPKYELPKGTLTREEFLNKAKETISTQLNPNLKQAYELILTQLETYLIHDDEIVKILSKSNPTPAEKQKIENLLIERKRLFTELLNLFATSTPPEKLAPQVETILEQNHQLAELLKTKKENTIRSHGWSEAYYLTVVQAPFLTLRYFRQPPIYKEYTKYLITELAKKGHKIITAPINAINNSTVTDPKSIASRLTTLESEIANLESKVAKIDPNAVTERQSAANKNLLEKLNLAKSEQKLLLQSQKLQEIQEEIARLTKTAPNSPELPKLKYTLQTETIRLDQFKTEHLSNQSKQLRAQIELEFKTMKDTVEVAGEKPKLLASHFEKFDNLVNETANLRKEIEHRIAERMKDLEKFPKGNPIHETALKEINQLFEERVRLDINSFDEITAFTKKWNTSWHNFISLQKGTLSPKSQKFLYNEEAQLRLWFNKMLGGTIENTVEGAKNFGKSMKAPLINSFKGNIIFYTAMLGTATYLNNKDNPNLEIEKSLKQAAIDILPISGTISDFYSAIEGKEYITEKKLDKTDRLLRAAFGVAGAFCDIASLAGIGLGARALLSSAKGAKLADKALTLRDAAKLVAEGAKEADRIKSLKHIKDTGRFTQGALLAGTLGTAGYMYIMKPAATREISPEVAKILGPQLSETNISPPKITN